MMVTMSVFSKRHNVAVDNKWLPGPLNGLPIPEEGNQCIAIVFLFFSNFETNNTNVIIIIYYIGIFTTFFLIICFYGNKKKLL